MSRKIIFFYWWQERYALTGMKTKNKPYFSTEMSRRLYNLITRKRHEDSRYSLVLIKAVRSLFVQLVNLSHPEDLFKSLQLIGTSYICPLTNLHLHFTLAYCVSS